MPVGKQTVLLESVSRGVERASEPHLFWGILLITKVRFIYLFIYLCKYCSKICWGPYQLWQYLLALMIPVFNSPSLAYQKADKVIALCVIQAWRSAMSCTVLVFRILRCWSWRRGWTTTWCTWEMLCLSTALWTQTCHLCPFLVLERCLSTR